MSSSSVISKAHGPGPKSTFELDLPASYCSDATEDQRVAKLMTRALLSTPDNQLFDQAVVQLRYLDNTSIRSGLLKAIHIAATWLQRAPWSDSNMYNRVHLSELRWMKALAQLPATEMVCYEQATVTGMAAGCKISREPKRHVSHIIKAHAVTALLQQGCYHVVAAALAHYHPDAAQIRALLDKIDVSALTKNHLESFIAFASSFLDPRFEASLPALLPIKVLKAADRFPQLQALAEKLWVLRDHEALTFEERELLISTFSEVAPQWLNECIAPFINKN